MTVVPSLECGGGWNPLPYSSRAYMNASAMFILLNIYPIGKLLSFDD